ncbi:MAG TPA: ACT domain-containing protein, partial [Anaerolineales bacterium]|nr:ACT domain-containing protein [Anaerolineales bacterium]
VPGLMGGVGSLLARHGINIAEWRLGRDQPGGMALSVLNLDSAPAPEVLEQMRELPQVVNVRLVAL